MLTCVFLFIQISSDFFVYCTYPPQKNRGHGQEEHLPEEVRRAFSQSWDEAIILPALQVIWWYFKIPTKETGNIHSRESFFLFPTKREKEANDRLKSIFGRAYVCSLEGV